jgi:hypothetical protein
VLLLPSSFVLLVLLIEQKRFFADLPEQEVISLHEHHLMFLDVIATGVLSQAI